MDPDDEEEKRKGRFVMRHMVFLVACSIMIASCGGSDGLSPSFSPPLGTSSPIVRGAYTLQSSDCDTNGSELSIIQDSTRLWFDGGFDYGQISSPGGHEYSGYIDSENTIHFTIVGVEETVTCTATLLEPVFQGICEFTSGDICDFLFNRADSVESPEETSTTPSTSPPDGEDGTGGGMESSDPCNPCRPGCSACEGESE